MSRACVLPTSIDILCGRGMHNFKHPGNAALRTKIFLKLETYLAYQRKRDKTSLIRSVIEDVLNEGGRFLKFDYTNKFWYDGGIAAAKTRVGVGFRDAKRPNRLQYGTAGMKVASQATDKIAANDHQPTNSARQKRVDRASTVLASPSSLWDMVVVPPAQAPSGLCSLPSPSDEHYFQESPSPSVRPISVSSLEPASSEHLSSRAIGMTSQVQKIQNNIVGFPPESQASTCQNHTATESDKTVRYLLQAVSSSHSDARNANSWAEEILLDEEEVREEIEEIPDGSTSTFWDIFTRESLVEPRRRCSTKSDDETTSKDESLFSNETLNEIFDNVEDPTVPWESPSAEPSQSRISCHATSSALLDRN